MDGIFKVTPPSQALEFTGERFTTVREGQQEQEYLHRYCIARDFCAGKDVLDIACGEGYGSVILSSVAKSVIGVDFDERTIDHARKSYPHNNIQFLQGSAIKLPLENCCVDVVVSFETLKHIKEHDLFAAEIKRVLRPGGLLIMSAPVRTVYSACGGSEFIALLLGYFANVALLKQRAILGSLVSPVEKAFSLRRLESLVSPVERAFSLRSYERRSPTHIEASSGLPRAPYFIAIATDGELPPLESSVYIDRYGVEEVLQGFHRVSMLEKAVAERNAAKSELEIAKSELEKAVAERNAARTEVLCFVQALDKAYRYPWKPTKAWAEYLILQLLSHLAKPFSSLASERFKHSAQKRSPRRYKKMIPRLELILADTEKRTQPESRVFFDTLIDKTDHSFSLSLTPEKKRAIVFNDYLIVPDRRGGDYRAFQILKIFLELGWEVDLAVLCDRKKHAAIIDEPDLEEKLKSYQELLWEIGIKRIIFGEENIKEFLSQQGLCYSLAYVFYPRVAYQFIPLIRYYAINAKLFYDPVDLTFLRLERKAAHVGKDLLVDEEAKAIKKIDILNFLSSDLVIAITEEEKEKIEEIASQCRVEVIPNIHEIHKPSSLWEDRKGILFLGYYGHEPNVDALKYFISEMWDKIQERLPGCSLEVVGSCLKEYVPKELLSRPGIQPIGYVRYLVPYLEKARVFVAPLRFGAGMKGKIGMAMASGLPVVTTSIGAEGMKLENGKTAFICDDKEGFVQAVIRLYEDKELWENVSQAGLKHMEAHFSQSAVKETLRRLLSFCPV
ncbi:glycosyltransferase [Candidatus Methylacidiphilum infernorum]|uniref:Glycosyltransferase n=1 Tax=Candidatus Methylacidiphilum infernorum TaxID=511746 RepID=A0ABX7PX56_9BACT|nr:glycosyltransferase [Candidatus Methylacidiphilum infernorum]QSR87492.1 glycosyltransferase [Candidatus Methylacidiphilum infernorum]